MLAALALLPLSALAWLAFLPLPAALAFPTLLPLLPSSLLPLPSLLLTFAEPLVKRVNAARELSRLVERPLHRIGLRRLAKRRRRLGQGVFQ